MKKLLSWTLSLGLISQLTAGHLGQLSPEEAETLKTNTTKFVAPSPEATQTPAAPSLINSTNPEENQAHTAANRPLGKLSPEELEARKAEQQKKLSNLRQRDNQLKAVGLGYSIQTPMIESVISCDKTKSIQSMDLVPGFALSFCSNRNLDWTKVNKTALLKFIQQEIEKELNS